MRRDRQPRRQCCWRWQLGDAPALRRRVVALTRENTLRAQLAALRKQLEAL